MAAAVETDMSMKKLQEHIANIKLGKSVAKAKPYNKPESDPAQPKFAP